jgi:toluene monooxygenase system protein B
MSEPQPLPVNARFEGDFVTQLVVILTTDTMDEVANKVAHHVIGKRLPAREAGMVVRYQGRALSAGTTVAEAGIGPFQNIFVNWVAQEGGQA